MRFMVMHWLDDRDPKACSPDPELVTQVGQLMGEMTEAGVLVTGDGLRPSNEGPGAIVRVKDGAQTVIDGPFPEAKEVVGGFVILDVESRADALAWARRYAGIICSATDNKVEVRKVTEVSDFSEEVQTMLSEQGQS